ncbi:MAG: PKD domain-containing protein, partial [Thermoplasmata archaeon]|nr:PKD domain-containing protein [Thermoplasmata archaeon]
PVHAFALAGAFTVRVVVSDATGSQAHATILISVSGALGGSVSASPASAITGQAVTLSAVPIGGTAPYAFAWTFGDGGSGTGPSAVHTYTSLGTYTVIVWINDSVGGSLTRRVVVDVAAAPTGDGSGGAPPPLPSTVALWFGIGLVAMVVVVAILLLRARSRPTEPGAPREPFSGQDEPPS